jgi:RNA polymerase sigma factor (sigma-70 family)
MTVLDHRTDQRSDQHTEHRIDDSRRDDRPTGVPLPDTEVINEPDLDDVGPGVSADLVRVYLDDIGRTPLLTAAEEVELSKRIEAGVYATELLRTGEDLSTERRAELDAVAADGRRAMDHMLRANLRLVVSVAKKHAHRGMPFLDVVQEGNLGLVRAVEKFDYARGYKFSTYATWWIRQAISRGLAEMARTVRLPVHVHEEVNKLARVTRELGQRLEREATDAEIAEALGSSVARVVELRQVSRDVVSLDAPIGDDGESSFGDLVVDVDATVVTDAVEQRAMAEQVWRAVDALPEREALILRMRFGLSDGTPRTLDEIGRALGLTRERIRQLEKHALAALRQPRTAETLLDWAS